MRGGSLSYIFRVKPERKYEKDIRQEIIYVNIGKRESESERERERERERDISSEHMKCNKPCFDEMLATEDPFTVIIRSPFSTCKQMVM